MIRGLAASPGYRRGRAFLALDPARIRNLQSGAILVASNIGPLWTPYYPILQGIVLDSGSLGQHAATTAREYVIPAVINTRIATRHIRDGDWITIDGNQGLVTIESKKENRLLPDLPFIR